MKQQLYVTKMPNFVLTQVSFDLQMTKSVLTVRACIDYFKSD